MSEKRIETPNRGEPKPRPKRNVPPEPGSGYENRVFNPKRITRAAVVAALYTALTLAFAPLSYGPLQIRFAEALTPLPALFPEAIAGVTVGCLISNLFSPAAVWADAVFGTAATFIAAVLTYAIGRRLKKSFFFAALPPVLVNAAVVPLIIFAYLQGDLASIGIGVSNGAAIYLLGAASVGIGQTIAVYGLGAPLYFGLRRFAAAR